MKKIILCLLISVCAFSNAQTFKALIKEKITIEEIKSPEPECKFKRDESEIIFIPGKKQYKFRWNGGREYLSNNHPMIQGDYKYSKGTLNTGIMNVFQICREKI